MGLVPACGAKIPHAAGSSEKKQGEKETARCWLGLGSKEKKANEGEDGSGSHIVWSGKP